MKKITFIFMLCLLPTLVFSWSLTNPGEDKLMGWDNSLSATDRMSWFGVGTGLQFNGATIEVIPGTYQSNSTALSSLAGLTETNGGIPYGTADNAYAWLAAGGSGKLLIGKGAAAPDWTPYTFPATVPTVGKVLISDGTNLVGSTALGSAAYTATTAYQAADADLDAASNATGSGNSKYFGTSAAGVVGLHDLPAASLGFDVDAPGASGGLLQSNGTKWGRVGSLSGVSIGNLTASMGVVSTASGILASHATVSATEVGYLDGVTSAIQTQLGDKAAKAGAIYTGTHDFGGADDVEIPNGSAPTVDTAGQIALDTTSDQLVYYGAAKRVIPYRQFLSFVIPAPAATDDINLLKAPYGMTILAINCIVQGTTSATGQLQECDSAGANCADLDADIACDADGAADDGSLTDSAIASAAWLRWKTTSLSGTPTFLTVTVTYSVVSD
jgi:hypothetical protein